MQVNNFNTRVFTFAKKKITACPSATWFLVSNKLIRCYTLAPSHKCRFVALNETILHTLLCTYIAIYLKYGDVEHVPQCEPTNRHFQRLRKWRSLRSVHSSTRMHYVHCISSVLLTLHRFVASSSSSSSSPSTSSSAFRQTQSCLLQ